MGVVSLNLPDVALAAHEDLDDFWEILEERLDLCKRMILFRIELLKGTDPSISPIHWKYGALARLEEGQTIDAVFDRFSCSLGYVGLYECIMALIGKSLSSEEGKKLGLDIMKSLTEHCQKWKEETGYGFSVYGSPAESTVYKFARKTKERYGVIENVTDRLYFTNSYHINVREPINAFDKLSIEGEFQKYSQGGLISYVECPNLINNQKVLEQIIDWIYETCQYAEINSKIDRCNACGYEGNMQIDDNLEWYCPNCGNRDLSKMNVARRVCGLTK